MDRHALVMITVGDREEARDIARRLVETGLAAGAQILPIDSIYRWQGDIVEDSEWLMLVKTRRDRFQAIESVVNEMHSYEVPPVLMIEMDDASRAVSRLDRRKRDVTIDGSAASGWRRHGGGAGSRTPVRRAVGAGISERSRQRAFGHRNSDDEFPCAYPELAWPHGPETPWGASRFAAPGPDRAGFGRADGLLN